MREFELYSYASAPHLRRGVADAANLPDSAKKEKYGTSDGRSVFLANNYNFDTKISWSGCITPLDTFDFV